LAVAAQATMAEVVTAAAEVVREDPQVILIIYL
jgi:hypothetical protein